MFNIYSFKENNVKGKKIDLNIIPNYPNDEVIEYTALDFLCYVMRTNIICPTTLLQPFSIGDKEKGWSNYVEKLDVLLSTRQNEIIETITTKVGDDGVNKIPRYYEIIWYTLFRDKNIELSQSNFDKLADTVICNSNIFQNYEWYHPINEILSSSNNISYNRIKKIINICTFSDDNKYFDKTFYPAGIITNPNGLDWRYYLLSRDDLPMGLKDEIIANYYTTKELKTTMFYLKQSIENDLNTFELRLDIDSIDADDYIRKNVDDIKIQKNNRVYKYISREVQNRNNECLVEQICKKDNKIKELNMIINTYEDDGK